MFRHGARSFSTTRPRGDAATCQLLGNFGSTPTRFTTPQGTRAARYLFAVNRRAPLRPPNDTASATPTTTTTSWFNVVAFDERSVERLTSEDLKGAKALINASFDVKTKRDEEAGTYSDQVNIRHVSMHLIERSKKTQGEV